MKYEQWSYGYWCVKQYIKFVDWIIYKNIILVGKEKIPKNKPILFAPNHQNALSDPMAILLHTKFQPVWLARADIFKKGMVTFLLRFLKIMPVYRMRDGKDQLAKNDKTFADSIKVLENNFALALFPEAAHSGKRQMIVHKKAVPRIVFMAEEKAENNLDIHIVPVGIYYSSYWKFNRNVIVNFGDPIHVNDFLDECKDNPPAATLSLRQKIYEAIDPLIINIKSKTHYNDFENIRELYGKYYLKRQGRKYSVLNLFKSDQLLTNKLDALETKLPEEIEPQAKDARDYDALVKKKKLRSWLIENPKNNFLMIALNKLVLLLGLPIFLYGFILNAIPFFTIDIIARKRVKDITFWSTFFLGLGIFLFPFIYLLEFFALIRLLPGIWLKLVFIISLPIAGKLAFKWYILFRKTVGRIRLFLMKLLDRTEYQKLQDSKDKLFNRLDNLISV
ncbi:1-acyl-sn-glycerol-3-phosphate acyltransferase [Draconibacterium sp.]|nr:1-acyl-sn-glycerol-3-phosphate acyltransferase [Draconibacterium sp.]